MVNVIGKLLRRYIHIKYIHTSVFSGVMVVNIECLLVAFIAFKFKSAWFNS